MRTKIMKVLAITEHVFTELYCLKIIIFRGSHVSLSWFSYSSSILVELDVRVLVFIERGKLETAEKKAQGKNQQQTQPTCDARLELNLGHISGRQALSPLHQPC